MSKKRKPVKRKAAVKRLSIGARVDQLTIRHAELTKFVTRQVRILLTRVDELQVLHNEEIYKMLEPRLESLKEEVERLERARGFLADRLKIIEETRPGWAKDIRGNPLPVYTPPKPNQEE
jgi:hypothetical protein